MKTTLKLSLVAILSLSLVNCGGGSSTPTDQNDTTPTYTDLNATLPADVTITKGAEYTVPTATVHTADGTTETVYTFAETNQQIKQVVAGDKIFPEANATLTATVTELTGDEQTVTDTQKIIVVPPEAPDTDHDGVLENDQCPNTTAGDKVNAEGCNAPTNFDGVNVVASGPLWRYLEGEVLDADGVKSTQISYSDGEIKTYSGGIINSESAHESGTEANITTEDELGNIKVEQRTL